MASFVCSIGGDCCTALKFKDTGGVRSWAAYGLEVMAVRPSRVQCMVWQAGIASEETRGPKRQGICSYERFLQSWRGYGSSPEVLPPP